MKTECVIFDCDGLMFDTETVANQCWRDIASRYGVQLNDEFFYRIIGCGHQQFLEAMADYPQLMEHMPEIRQHRLDTIYSLCETAGRLNKKGLVELLNWLQANGIRKCVASSSHREYVEKLLGSIGCPVHFDGIVCGDEVTHGKPDPEIFLTAAAKAKVAPQHCLVLEDSKFGIMAAKRAGMNSVWIYDFVKPDEEMELYLQQRCDSLLDVIELLKKEN